MIHTSILIVGQGIAGTLVAWECYKRQIPFYVIDQLNTNCSSYAAAALMNPLLAKKWTLVQKAQQYQSQALSTYQDMGRFLNQTLVEEKFLEIHHSNTQASALFQAQIDACNPYTFSTIEAHEAFTPNPSGYGLVKPIYKVNNPLLLKSWHSFLSTNQLLLQAAFNFDALHINAQDIHYETICAQKIIFCEGVRARNNPYFPELKFTANKGEFLHVHIPGLSAQAVYQKDLRLVPLENDLFWCGTNYVWQYDQATIDPLWRKKCETLLQSWLRIPFQIVQHGVAERPTTAGQKPFCMQHEMYKHLYCFNGLGTRAFSAGPTLAQELMSKVLAQ